MILVPYGKYDVSKDALQYAIDFASAHQIDELLCFRATEHSLSQNELSALKEEIQHEIAPYLKDNTDLSIEITIENGAYDHVIDKLVASHPIRMIIAGIRKAKGLEKVLFQGKAAKILRHTDLPVILIPEHFAFSPIQKIMFASDFKPIPNDDALDPLVEIAKISNAEIRIAHVRTEKGHLSEEEILEMNRESALFKEIPHSFKHIHRSTISKGINYYLKLKGDHDLLVLVKRKKGLIGRTFSHDHAIEFALQPKLPLLILNEG